jgi:hypothetical protein
LKVWRTNSELMDFNVSLLISFRRKQSLVI